MPKARAIILLGKMQKKKEIIVIFGADIVSYYYTE